MGLLSVGTPLSWSEAKELADIVRDHGITQFLNTYNLVKGREKDCLSWGDEIEYLVVRLEEGETPKMLLCAESVIESLNRSQAQKSEKSSKDLHTNWNPEFGRHMIEGVPGFPYGPIFKELLNVEFNMKARRLAACKSLPRDVDHVLSLTNFPLFGVKDTIVESESKFQGLPFTNEASKSLFIPDELINKHPRFKTLTRNIRERRGEKVCMHVPIFKDTKTPSPFVEDFSQSATFPAQISESPSPLPDHIYLDAMPFGMGCCCLQVTFQASSIREARLLYDQLIPLAPLFLAISAGSPIWRGYLSDVDCRWSVIAGSVDDRSKEERDPNSSKFIPKSRYDSVDCYISNEYPELRDYCNDVPVKVNEEIYQRLVNAGLDNPLARHIAHLFIRDPLVIYKELLEQDNHNSMDHFENIQSTNWQTVRFKPPPVNSKIGWRVEFRSMEVQLTDFENAAFCIFLALLTRCILSFKLNFMAPISMVDTNMQRSQRRDAIHREKFYFAMETVKPTSSANSSSSSLNSLHSDPANYQELTLNEIFNGKGECKGLVGIVKVYLYSVDVDVQTRQKLDAYIDFISKRASGEIPTSATDMRNFVRDHPDYQFDSSISPNIARDLLKKISMTNQ